MIESLFFASSNQDKIKEIKTLFRQQLPQLQVLTLLEYPQLEHEVLETGQTYQENAWLKASSYQKLITQPVLADDSGMEVVAYPNLLGVNSARWHQGTQKEKNLAVLSLLQNKSDRRLIYHCVLCLLLPQKEALFFTGIYHGFASLNPSSETGFGYDPIFIPEGEKETLTTLGSDFKNQHSHRRQALDQLITYLSQT